MTGSLPAGRLKGNRVRILDSPAAVCFGRILRVGRRAVLTGESRDLPLVVATTEMGLPLRSSERTVGRQGDGYGKKRVRRPACVSYLHVVRLMLQLCDSVLPVPDKAVCMQQPF